MLTHNRQRSYALRSEILQINLANPLHIRLRPIMTNKTILFPTRGNTCIAASNALIRIYQHSPTMRIRHSLISGAGLRKPHQHNARD